MNDEVIKPTRLPPPIGMGAIILFSVTLFAMGVVVGGVWMSNKVPDLVSPSSSVSTISVSSQLYDGRRTMSVVPQVSTSQVVHTGMSGLITASSCNKDQAVASGGSSWAIDGQPILALFLANPLWRDLAPSMEGADVSALQSELSRLGYDAPQTGVFDWNTRQVVDELLATLGATLPSDGILPQGWVIWLPHPDFIVSTCSVTVGDRVIMGDVLAEATGKLRALVLSDPPGDGWVATYGEHTAPVDGQGAVTDQALLSAFESGPEYQHHSETSTGSLSLTVSLAEPLTVIAVPPSAVVVHGSGSGCLVSENGVWPVRIISSSLGQTYVEVEGNETPSQVALHPDEAVTC